MTRTLRAATLAALTLTALALAATPAAAAPSIDKVECWQVTGPKDVGCRFTPQGTGTLAYHFSWADGTIVKGSVAAGTVVELLHTYTADGAYYVSVQATDSAGATSPWKGARIDAAPPYVAAYDPRDGKIYRGCGSVTDSVWNNDPPRAWTRGCLWVALYDNEVRLAGASAHIPGACPGSDYIEYGDSASPLVIKVQYDVCVYGDLPVTVTAYDMNGNVATWSKTVRHVPGTCTTGTCV